MPGSMRPTDLEEPATQSNPPMENVLEGHPDCKQIYLSFLLLKFPTTVTANFMLLADVTNVEDTIR